MATTLSIVVLVLLLTGVATATVYALPIISQVTADQASNGDVTQIQDRERKGEMMQMQDRLRLREGSQNGNGPCEESGTSDQGSSEASATEDAISPGPAPSSGDGIPSGNQYIQPETPGVGPAPNSGDGIPDGSGF
ncbi:MAG: hypothetical protein NWF13_07020 [Candidatus Bathyarchaeota archaeon]|nr:hypothetical protein [Candidatus Bathyarchaeota archaeon]